MSQIIIIIINVFSWVTDVRILSLAGSHSLPHLPRMPSNSFLVSGPTVRAAPILIWSCACVFLPLVSTAIRTSVFSFLGALNVLLYRVYLVNCVDLIWTLYSWWESFGSCSLATLPLGFNCGFISTSACGLSTVVCSWGCPGGLGFVLVRARCGVGAATWVAGVLAAPGTRGWWLGKQEIYYFRRVWQPVMANMLQYSRMENPLPWQRSLAGHSL